VRDRWWSRGRCEEAAEFMIDVRVWGRPRRRNFSDLSDYRRVPGGGDGGRRWAGPEGWRRKKPLSTGRAKEDQAIDGRAEEDQAVDGRTEEDEIESRAEEKRLAVVSLLECDLQANACANFREGDKEGNRDWFPNNVSRSHTFPLIEP
jgi:hypothetical protein